jgi:hypothetical protein
MEVQTESICEDYGIICVTRDGSNTRKLIFENDFLYEHRRNILLVDEWIQNDISSTKIRYILQCVYLAIKFDWRCSGFSGEENFVGVIQYFFC